MTKKASSSFRRSVLIDPKRHPELAYLERLTGWGEQSAEIVRLARLGAECELQERALLEELRSTARRRAMAQVNALSAGVELAPVVMDPEPERPTAPPVQAAAPTRLAEPPTQQVASHSHAQVLQEKSTQHFPDRVEEVVEMPEAMQPTDTQNTDNPLLSQFLR